MSKPVMCKTVRQYSKGVIPERDMEKLREIAEDYRKVKNYVYARYGSIGSLSKLYPGYTVQNEMTASGLRSDLEMPSVYFYLAVFDALGDIKAQWSRTKSKILELVGKHEGLSPEEKHYLRFLMKVNNAFEAVLNEKEIRLPKELQKKQEELASLVDTEKLHRYLCRQARKYHEKQHTSAADGFALSEKAYRYGDHGIYISIKEKRKRVFVPLTDNNEYKRQLYIRLYPDEGKLEVRAPVDVAVKSHKDYTNVVGIAMGYHTMLTTDQGHRYGEELGRYQTEYAEWMRRQTGIYNRNRKDNPGREKYEARKRRYTSQLHSYINQELNRFLREEKPEVVYMAKLPKPYGGGVSRKINHSVSMWQRGYIRRRLELKCSQQSVEMAEVFGKGISSTCSSCGAKGVKADGIFRCPLCGYESEEKVNTARNVKKRGTEDESA
ncbi:MAG: transposase [Hungatella sp.]|nr:transposase [Hungatella sp.]